MNQSSRYSRRSVLSLAAGAFLSASGALLPSGGSFAAEAPRAALVYFSRTGATAGLARMVAEASGAEVFELKLVDPYSDDYSAMTGIARSERSRNARRELAKPLPDLSGFDLIFLGSPYWWGGLSIPVRTFLMDNPLAGKRVAPFVVSASSSPEGAWEDLREFCPQARILPGFHTVQSAASGARGDITAWVKSCLEARQGL